MKQKKNRAILSIHDVTPAWTREVEDAVALVYQKHGIKPALFVIPNYHHEWPLEAHPDYAQQVHKWAQTGFEIFLHGMYHLDGHNAATISRKMRAALLTANEGEFLNLGATEVKSRIEEGMKTLATTGAHLSGFIPPAWLYNRELEPVLAGTPLRFWEGHLYIRDNQAHKKYLMPAISFCARKPVQTALSQLQAATMAQTVKTPLTFDFRLALHPVDFKSPALVRAIDAFLTNAQDTIDWISYNQLN